MSGRYLLLVAVVCFLVGVLILLREAVPAPTSSTIRSDVMLPENYRELLVHYATIDRPDNRSRDIYISPGAAERIANNSTARLPDGTLIVIEAHRTTRGGGRAGLTDNIHVAIKRSDWQASDYQTDERAGQWNYFSFDPETGSMSDEDIFQCFDCHANNSQIDFIFTRESLADYGHTSETQVTFCRRPGRLAC